MATMLWALGLVLIAEGLVLALLPGRLEGLLDALRAMPPEARRLAGLLALVAGVGLTVLARRIGA